MALFNSEILVWLLLIAVIVASVVYYRRLRHNSVELRSNLQQQKRLIGDNVEHSLVLKMMKLNTWRIDVATKVYTVENDYRDTNDVAPMASGKPYSTMTEFIVADDRQKVIDNLTDICEGKIQSYNHEYRVMISGMDGKYGWEKSFAIVGEYDSDGKPKTIVGASHRIDDRKQMEEALLSAARQSEENNRIKTSFLQEMSHEIRTPLNSMNGYSQLLQSEDLTEEEKKSCIDTIIDNTDKLAKKFNNLLKIVETESGQESVKKQNMDVNLLVRNLTMKAEAENSNENIKVEYHTPMNECVIVSDPQLITIILNNYISNAFKFTRRGSVTIGYDSPADGKIKFWVKDTGIGLDKKQQAEAFNMFVKFNNFIEGVGLGLSVCKNLAINLGGNVGVNSASGVGSTFWVEIPTK